MSVPTRQAERFDVPDAEALRSCAWHIGQRRPADAFVPAANHVGLAMVSPCRGFAHWQILDDWILGAAEEHGDAWRDCDLILRLYDVSYIEFNGFNANGLQDHVLPGIAGHYFFDLSHSGTWQIAEVGFLLRNGEFVPAARSAAVSFADGSPSPNSDHTALLVDGAGRVEEVVNLWDQERILSERRTPKLRSPLRIAMFSIASPQPDGKRLPGKFICELSAGLAQRGHDVHVFTAASDGLSENRQDGDAHCEQLDVDLSGSPLEQAQQFAQAARRRLRGLPAFDLIHLHEWMTADGAWFEGTPTILSMTSIEATRRNGARASSVSLAIEQREKDALGSVDCILIPDWLRETAFGQLDMDRQRTHTFPMEGRLPNEWDCPLDYGQFKQELGFGPLDRTMLFVGPLEHAAGPDLLVEALPVLMPRYGDLRLIFAGSGNQHDHLQHRANELGLGFAVRLLGDVDRGQLVRMLRSSEALILPSRYRVPLDDAVVDLARRAGRPVITTHGGPAHLISHEETGVITYDNPGSIVWAMDRILGDPVQALRMGECGRPSDGFVLNWNDVADRYAKTCALCFPDLTEARRACGAAHTT